MKDEDGRNIITGDEDRTQEYDDACNLGLDENEYDYIRGDEE